MPLPIHFTVRGRPWVIEVESIPDLWGLCDRKRRRITLHARLKYLKRRRLEIIIHETLHAIFPAESEAAVTAAAKIIAGVLWSDEWRRSC